MRESKKINRQTSGNKNFWLLKFGLIIFLLAGFYFGGRYAIKVISHRFFALKDVAFSGNKHISEGELKAMLELRGNEGLLEISSKETVKKLLKTKWIKTASLRKDFPHKLLIQIEESTPFALLELNGRTFFIDENGNMLEEISSASIPFLPVISGDPYKNNSTFLETLHLVRAIKDRGYSSTKGRVEVMIPKNSQPEDISIQIDGILVKVGYGEYEEKLERLLELEAEIIKRGIPVDYIDLRFANRVIVKPINEVIR